MRFRQLVKNQCTACGHSSLPRTVRKAARVRRHRERVREVAARREADAVGEELRAARIEQARWDLEGDRA